MQSRQNVKKNLLFVVWFLPNSVFNCPHLYNDRDKINYNVTFPWACVMSLRKTIKTRVDIARLLVVLVYACSYHTAISLN